ncbi:hypothetical protein NTD80_21205 [Pseudomonas sp. 13B_2.1_Bac1]|uniref:hypothetical protein n=1 Tax=Pseudomonas sp. 13B_2.1_Bac1 TaxID=2971624 RepID=UPI0021C618E2|nr:hypothetical protein [Pseudomonas sp. 13B_2.1_Bac1]MCU1785267.1 hypothetical protein [Pseudomonas sp. 13B_2.1_Bac1]
MYLADRVVVLQPRPGRITDIVDIDFARPRQRSGYDFYRLKEALLHRLTKEGEYELAEQNLLKEPPLRFIAQ